jgi:hypothetical protein
MSINILVGKDRIEVEFIEWRPGEGLVLRVANEMTEAILESLTDGLYGALRNAPCAIYRTCCDSTPGCAHAEGCEALTEEKPE